MKPMKPDGTVYAKLLAMAKEEAQGRKKVKIKDLCRGIAKRFRLNNKEVFTAIKEANSNSDFGKLNRHLFEL